MSAETRPEPAPRYRNYYRCERCGHEWNDEWSCQCDDECPSCGARDMTPYRSEDVEGPSP